MDFVEQVKSSANIVHVVGQYVGSLTKSGRDTYKGLCPFHQEKQCTRLRRSIFAPI